MEFLKVLEEKRKEIDHEVSEFMRAEMDDSLDDPLTREMLEAIGEYTLRGGKRIRAILLMVGYAAVGGKEIEKIKRASVSLELIQSMLLIHDDIIDRSPERRGGPSFHRIFEELHKSRGYSGDGISFGINMAVIGGDLAESMGEKALVTSGFPPERVVDALVCQANMIRDTGFGQVLDLYSESLPEWSEEMVIKVQKFKTARYTLEGPLHIGAKLHGATSEQLKALSDYAIPVGIAFQIVDDILGFNGDPKRGGKEDLADIVEGKRTLLIMKALEMTNEEERKMIFDCLGKKDLRVEEAESLRELIRNCGSEQYSRFLAERLSREGVSALETTVLDEDSKTFLRALSGYLLSRA